MKLYSFGESGNAYKCALALEMADLEWEPVFVDFFKGEARGPEFKKINEMGEVPVLVDGDTTLTQSGVILDYISSKTGKLGGRSAAERREVLRWLFWDNHKLTSYTATYRFLRTFVPNADPAVVEEFRKRSESAWKILDTHLAGKTYMVDDRVTIADLSICGYLFFDDELGVDWNNYPNVRDWLQRLRSQPGWKHPYDLLPGHPLPQRAAAK